MDERRFGGTLRLRARLCAHAFSVVCLVALGAVVPACAFDVDEEDDGEDVETTAHSEEALKTTGKPTVKRFPVAGKHNLGWDSKAKTYKCNGANANTDYYTRPGDANHKDGHLGNDIFGAKGTKLVAVTDGKVAKVATGKIGGHTITIVDKNGWSYYYAHMQSPSKLKVGAKVTTGTEVGKLGDSGQAKGTPHLHFSIYPNGNYNQGIDPFKYLAAVDQDACD
jgi:murein DD-endopeptidase MepM/ murein hydrolase activator NlpD